MENDFSILKQIWQNRGFGKYTLFGGLAFYLRLRVQFFAYFFSAITALLLFFGVYRTYENYEPTYWRQSVYYETRKIPVFTLEAHTDYTFKVTDDVELVMANGRYFATPNSRYLVQGNIILPYNFGRTFHVRFPYKITIGVQPELNILINDVISEKVELYKYKQEGIYVDYQLFEPHSSYYYHPDAIPPNKKKTDKKKTNKKKK